MIVVDNYRLAARSMKSAMAEISEVWVTTATELDGPMVFALNVLLLFGCLSNVQGKPMLFHPKGPITTIAQSVPRGGVSLKHRLCQP